MRFRPLPTEHVRELSLFAAQQSVAMAAESGGVAYLFDLSTTIKEAVDEKRALLPPPSPKKTKRQLRREREKQRRQEQQRKKSEQKRKQHEERARAAEKAKETERFIEEQQQSALDKTRARLQREREAAEREAERQEERNAYLKRQMQLAEERRLAGWDDKALQQERDRQLAAKLAEMNTKEKRCVRLQPVRRRRGLGGRALSNCCCPARTRKSTTPRCAS